MTRKDYQVIAEALALTCFEESIEPQSKTGKAFIFTMADKLHQENPAFNHERFISYITKQYDQHLANDEQ